MTPTPQSPSPSSPAPTPEPDPTLGLLELVNRARIDAGCPPVANNPALQAAAQQHSDAQAAAGQMHHSDGPAGFDTWGENVAAGYDTAAAVFDGWMGSSGHRDNVLACDFTVMGVGSTLGEGGVRYWTQLFAVRLP